MHLVRLRDMEEATGGLGDEEDVGDAGTGFGVEVEEELRKAGEFGEEPEKLCRGADVFYRWCRPRAVCLGSGLGHFLG